MMRASQIEMDLADESARIVGVAEGIFLMLFDDGSYPHGPSFGPHGMHDDSDDGNR